MCDTLPPLEDLRANQSRQELTFPLGVCVMLPTGQDSRELYKTINLN